MIVLRSICSNESHFTDDGNTYYVDPKYSEAPPKFYLKHPEELQQNHEYQKQLIMLEQYSQSNSVSSAQTPTNEIEPNLFERVAKTYCYYNDVDVHAMSTDVIDKICQLTNECTDFNEIMNKLVETI